MTQRELAPVAALLGELLLVELSEARLRAIRQPEVTAALEDLGIELPHAGELESLAADFFDRFINPHKGYPLVESLYRGGAYEGDSARAVRQIADAAGLEYSPEAARGATDDHLGSELILWSRLVTRDEEAASEFARRHLTWAPDVLKRSEAQMHPGSSPFYSQIARATADFVHLLL